MWRFDRETYREPLQQKMTDLKHHVDYLGLIPAYLRYLGR
jgi:hypothetical protein